MNIPDKLTTELIKGKAHELKVPDKVARYVLNLEYSVNLLQKKVDRLNGSK